MDNIIFIIPAYNPPDQIQVVSKELSDTFDSPIVLVDDGSEPGYDSVFAKLATFPKVTMLKHAVNLGKGAALKTAFNHVLCNHPNCQGVVTVDADGQHQLTSVKNVYQSFSANSANLVLGVRAFGQENVPLKNRFGNILTRTLFCLIHHKKLQDTQTGLRAIPTQLLPDLLKLPANGYEFELKMLVHSLLQGYTIEEVEIATVYLNKNASSHFRPLVDSYKVLKALMY